MRNQRPPTRSPYARWSRPDTVPSTVLNSRRAEPQSSRHSRIEIRGVTAYRTAFSFISLVNDLLIVNGLL